jgi:predicted nicotinamide N-methyase
VAQVWDGALALARYLCHFPDTIQSKCAVVELGSGTGILGCVVSRLGASKVVLYNINVCMCVYVCVLCVCVCV